MSTSIFRRRSVTKRSPFFSSSRQKSYRGSLIAGSVLLASALGLGGCLRREVVEQSPNTSNVFVEKLQSSSIKAIDMLFVIDNSVSMSDKQQILEQAVPKMLERLLTPDCVEKDANGNVIDRAPANADGSCNPGFQREFQPVSDMHIGVITSSLGGHGAPDVCVQQTPTDAQNDRGYLITKVRDNVQDNTGLGFLKWDPENDDAQDDANITPFVDLFSDQVVAAGEDGCGFEAPLEAWYRFLVDANPPYDVVVAGEATTQQLQNAIGPEGELYTYERSVLSGRSYSATIDEEIRVQRQAFLRPDSLVAIVVLTDENDCSANGRTSVPGHSGRDESLDRTGRGCPRTGVGGCIDFAQPRTCANHRR